MEERLKLLITLSAISLVLTSPPGWASIDATVMADIKTDAVGSRRLSPAVGPLVTAPWMRLAFPTAIGSAAMKVKIDKLAQAPLGLGGSYSHHRTGTGGRPGLPLGLGGRYRHHRPGTGGRPGLPLGLGGSYRHRPN